MNITDFDGTIVVPVYVLHIGLALSLVVCATLTTFLIRAGFRNLAAKRKIKRTARAIKQDLIEAECKKREQKNSRNKRDELESMFPSAWLKAYDVCEKIDDKEIRFIWLEAFFDRARAIGAQPSMPFLSIEAAAKFAAMISGWSCGSSFNVVLRMFRPYFNLETTANADSSDEWHDTVSPDGWHGFVPKK